MTGWIQIFKTGRHVDSSGREREWGREDLDRVVSSYDPLNHEAPVVIGHPQENGPAFGWVEGLKREGEILYARLKDLLPEFVDMVKRGLFKKRSVAFYPDLTLRHVGFLGAAPPAIKGLEDIKFQEGRQFIIDFSDMEGIHNSWEGEAEMSSHGTRDPGKELQKRVEEIMRHPQEHLDKNFQRLPENITYSQALRVAQEESPELAQEYAESVRPQESEKHKKAMAAGQRIVDLVEGKRKAEKNLSYAEALDQVQKENPELIMEYLDQ